VWFLMNISVITAKWAILLDSHTYWSSDAFDWTVLMLSFASVVLQVNLLKHLSKITFETNISFPFHLHLR
jgi:hypothetical protein